MGIKGLAKLLSDEAPDCIREVELKSLHGRKIAIDASMSIYQFMIAVRTGSQSNPSAMLTNDDGEPTSHIQGMFNRTIRYMTEGLRPVFVFDGKPPSFKSGELLKRREKREKAEAALKTAEEEGDVEEQGKQSKRLVRAGQKENEDCMRLLELMGVPIVKAPCEAEAQAAALAKAGLVYATGTEDMDALTFATPVLLRKMTFANASKSTIQQMDYKAAIDGLELTHEQFVDLCIMLGCDYCDSIKGVGPKTALKLIREHGNIETILKKIDRKKFTVPDAWVPEEKAQQNKDDNSEDEEGDNKQEEDNKSDNEENLIPAYVQARKLFMNHEVLDKGSVELKWKPCQPEALTKFLVEQMGFSPDRVSSNIEKLQNAYKEHSKPQLRMTNFFTVKPQDPEKVAAKRKALKEKNKANAKKAKAGKKKR
ncbi:Flap endonuclease 1 [Seminavis robusta]|uniref:Flap endonuclease 1 n=1 Tax=Seminavis robusta TaxID=568900 RepID=A0A9N8DR31_9STRA|nr:Flap endonuclease 1 [Seminavis robusta]|eukprot:Sro292_g109630.1 Flap endonuclease 1 (424) ;mRNA; f:49966-51378